MSAIAELLVAVDITGPVLLVADNDAIARAGPVWAAALAGRPYRVRLVDRASSAAIAAVAAEARHLGAAAILWAGAAGPRAVAGAVARELGLPEFPARLAGADGE